jgi:hypothetical protein
MKRKLILVLVIVIALAFAAPPMARANRGGPALVVPCLLGATALGALIGLAAPRPAVAVPPPPPQCFKMIPVWGEPRWDPNRKEYLREQVSERPIRVLCPAQ